MYLQFNSFTVCSTKLKETILCYEICSRGVLTYIHTHSNEWMKDTLVYPTDEKE